MTMQEAYQSSVERLVKRYELQEARNISEWVMEYLTGQKRVDRLMNRDASLPVTQQETLEAITAELETGKPLQYVLNEAWFAGMKLYVDEHVLIPRPETEELADWIIEENRDKAGLRILDVGTGSGCIAIALAKALPKNTVRAFDVSEGALNVAIRNAMLQGVRVYFSRLDFLDEQSWQAGSRFNVIVSNPPYIPLSDAAGLEANVVDFEPHDALFVPEDDALLFYRKIAGFADAHLEAGGTIYMEINEALGKEVVQLFSAAGYRTELRKDLQQKERMVKAWKPV